MALNGDPPRQHGWAVPTATDIAFAVLVVRVFLLTLSIIAILFSRSAAQGLHRCRRGHGMVLRMQRIGLGAAWAYAAPGLVV